MTDIKEQQAKDKYSFDEFIATMREYSEKFGDSFPNIGFPGGADACVEEARKCIKSGKPYVVDVPKDALI